MNAQLEHVGTEQIIPENWERSNTSFTSDELITAYQIGKKAGMDFQQKVMREKFISNINLAAKTAEKFYAFFLESKIEPHVRLRTNSIESFDFAFLLDEEIYHSDKLDAAYEYAHELRTSLSNDTFSIYFYLFPKTSRLDLNRMISDGFSVFYEPKSPRSAPGPSNS
jgi:hypothetical protein